MEGSRRVAPEEGPLQAIGWSHSAMPPRPGNTALVPLHVDRKRGEPLHRQVYRDLVQLILSGRLRPAARMPSSRMLADDLGVARNTVLLALEQLLSEGYI